jgi:hypothetical protein
VAENEGAHRLRLSRLLPCDEAGGWIGIPDVRLEGTPVLLQYEPHRPEAVGRRHPPRRAVPAHGYDPVRLVSEDILVRPARALDRVWEAVERHHTGRR